MIRKYRGRTTETSTVDLLFVIVLVLLPLVALLMMLPKKPADGEGMIEPKAEFMIFMDWDDNLDVDFDIWLKTPDEQIVFFEKKWADGIKLERDDQGNLSDHIGDDIIRINQEVVTIRGTIPGVYVLNIHLYSALQKAENYPVDLRILKINPYREVFDMRTIFELPDEERTIVVFKVDEKGNAKILLDHGEIPLVERGLSG